MSKRWIFVKQYSSAIRRPAYQGEILKRLGLGRINRVRRLENTPAIWGMIHKVSHLIRIVEGESC